MTHAETASRAYHSQVWIRADTLSAAAAQDINPASFWPDLRGVMATLAARKADDLIGRMAVALGTLEP